jgi:hypothetical protein
MLRYYRARADYVFYSAAFNTEGVPSLSLNFLTYVNHFSGSGLYALEAGYSHDGENWYAAWHEEPSASQQYEVSVPIEGGSATTYVGFWCKGNPYYFNYWYLDDVEVKAMGLDVEYMDDACQGDDLEPGQSRTFYFDDWTPDFLQYETTAWEVPYLAEAVIEVEGDRDPGNDIVVNHFELDYWHDAGIEEVQSPADIGRQNLLWDNGDPDGRNGLAGSMYSGYSNLIIDDFQNSETWTARDGHFRFIWNSGYSTGNIENVKIYFFQETGDCDPSLDEYEVLDATKITETATGSYYFGRPEIAVDVEFDDVLLEQGEWWVGFQPEGKSNDIGYMLTAQGSGCEIMIDLPYWGIPRWTKGSDEWPDEYDLAWQLTGEKGGAPGIAVYIQPGTQKIEALAMNYGTFPEMGLTCYAEIWEYITDPKNGTKLYEDTEGPFNLPTPLGGTYTMKFSDFLFADEGRYGLFLDMPNDDDDFPKNNKKSWGIGVDNTAPESTHSLDPPNPDGENGWYVSDLEVSLQASDPHVMDVSSKVKEIRYTVNGGPEQVITGNSGSFLLTVADDGKDVEVEYWALDNVENEELPHNQFTIDMDQTDPIIDLTYEVVGGSPSEGWEITFTAEATDETSGMHRVEFFLNGLLQETIVDPGPTYEWTIWYHILPNVIFEATGFDMAGNSATDAVENPDFIENQQQQSQPQQHQQQKTQKIIL